MKTRKPTMFYKEKKILSRFPYCFIVLVILSIRVLSMFPSTITYHIMSKLGRILAVTRVVKR
jgi:hypothetical protein